VTFRDPLCALPEPPAAGCCDPPPAPPAAPRRPTNLPGLSRVAYRSGDFTAFRRAMLDHVARPDLLGTTPNPFARWREGGDGDYHAALIELWAYLADILTFYQELIANEAFLPTATQRDSLARIAALIGYRPGPGAAAAGQLAFTVAKGRTVSIPTSFRAGSRPAPGKLAAVFETEAPLTATGEHSAIPLSAVAPTNQFAPLAAFGAIYGGQQFVQSELLSLFATLYGGAGAVYAESYAPNVAGAATSATLAGALLASAAASAAPEAAPSAGAEPVTSAALAVSAVANLAAVASSALASVSGFAYLPFRGAETRAIVLKGVSTRLSVGDYVLSVENEQAGGERARVHQLDTVRSDKAAATTTITWKEPAGDPAYSQSAKPVALYALRVVAAPFGSNAPIWATLPQTLIGRVNNLDGPYKSRDWDDLSNDAAYVPRQGTLMLDSVYDDARGTAANPGWVVLLADGHEDVFHVADARPVNFADYALNNKVTRLTLGSGELAPNRRYPLRTTLVLTGAEALELQNNLPLPAEVAGTTLILAGQYPRLVAGQAVFLKGAPLDASSGQPATTVAAEPGVLAEAPVVDAANNVTTVRLQQALSRSYVRDGAALMANVVAATQGETVRDELLGSGDGAPFQSFALKQKPLTYLPASDPEGLAAVASTLLVTVNGVRWDELPTVLESPPDAQVYTATQDDAGATTVLFGDGTNGARPPSGRDNVRARYRKGLGLAGNVEPDGISQLIDNLPGLQKVTNPAPAIGGADAESSAQIRSNAPAALRTFGRAVSVDDYGALARSYPGVAKASAAWVLRDPATLRALTHPYVQLTVALAGAAPLAEQPGFAGSLRSFIDKRRDPNVPLRIVDFTPVFVDVAATLQIDARYPHQATLNAAYAAMRPGPSAAGAPGFFAFESLDFGESLHLSALYAALQAVPGIAAATITTFRRTSDPLGAVRDDIFIRPTEVAVLADDPADTANQRGKLLLIGEGGFGDT
jgi:predicted phage baseplate assembly protein